ncbi:hypothetical protein HTX81_08490 [Pseudomonas lini]|uniref:hypothetical protein n=1 Tax=Pseudomonas TaxID=286 RepID=UPI000579797D|nr:MULTISPECIES: hypothetical protein [Pseudomonas]MDT9678150.1 hypothetical protein [Pseudomonas sp. JV414]NSX08613.1 hypothetical protein [Pseudomonas lini]
MILNLFKVVMISSVLLLSACSGVNTSTCFSEACQQFDGHSSNKLNLGGSAIGNSFNEYSSGLLHD